MNDHIIELSNIKKNYYLGSSEVAVLKGVDLAIARSERVALMGRSGAGKSTLMNIIGLLDKATSGDYLLNGTDVRSLNDEQLSKVRGKTIGFIFQSFHLLPNISVLENVELPLEYQNVLPKKRRDRAKDLLDKVGLSHRFTHRPNQLSGGERQRVAIARSLANDPLLVLADEPTGNLDSKAQKEILELFDSLHEKTKITMIMVTHDPLIAKTCERTINIYDGRIIDPGQALKGQTSPLKANDITLPRLNTSSRGSTI